MYPAPVAITGWISNEGKVGKVKVSYMSTLPKLGDLCNIGP